MLIESSTGSSISKSVALPFPFESDFEGVTCDSCEIGILETCEACDTFDFGVEVGMAQLNIRRIPDGGGPIGDLIIFLTGVSVLVSVTIFDFFGDRDCSSVCD